MIHGVKVILIISSLLACPLNCLGMFVDDDHRAQALVAATCPCCPHSEPTGETDPANDSPVGNRDGDCQCSSCLCRGAVLPDNDDLGSDTLTGVHFHVPCGMPAIGIAPTAHTDSDASTISAATAVGRAVRIAHQSFLL